MYAPYVHLDMGLSLTFNIEKITHMNNMYRTFFFFLSYKDVILTPTLVSVRFSTICALCSSDMQ